MVTPVVTRVSENVETHVVPPDEADSLEAVWSLKERIRETDGVLGQNRPHFEREYYLHRAFLLRSATDRASVRAFAIGRADGYVSVLGVDPRHRRRGLGSRLLEEILDVYLTISCHTRTTNREAIEFYEQAGFTVEQRIEEYYRDGTDALELRYVSDGIV